MIPTNRKLIQRDPTPAEHRDLVAYAQKVLSLPPSPSGALDRFLADGTLPAGTLTGSTMESETGRIFAYDKQGAVRLYRPSEPELEAHVNYFLWRQGVLAEEPPAPSSLSLPRRGVWVGMTWAQVRRELLQADQLALEVAA